MSEPASRATWQTSMQIPALEEGGGGWGGVGGVGLHTTIQKNPAVGFLIQPFFSLFFFVGGGGFDSFMSVMLHTNSFCELLHSSYGNGSQKEA